MGTKVAGDDAGTILFGKTRRRVLGLLLGHPGEAFYLRQVVRRTGSPQGAVQRELDALTRASVVLRAVRGRQVYFEANRDSPIFPELTSLVMKTVGIVDVLRDALASVASQIRLAFVFGSAARGDLVSGSDIDLLVVGSVEFTDVVGAFAGVQEQLAREVNPTIYPPAEFRAKLRGGHHFLTSLLTEPRMYVIGDQDELDRLGAKRLGDGARANPKRDPRPARRRRARSRG